MNSCVSCAHGPAMETTPERSSSSLEPPNHVVALPRDPATARSQLRDLIAILALPAVWSGRDAADIPEAVLEVLSSMLRLDLAYIRAADPAGSGPLETVRVRGRSDLGSRGREIAGFLAQGTTEPDASQALVLPDPATGEPLRATRIALGLPGHTGVVIAASRRSSFPTPFERFLLQSIITQAEVALRNAADRPSPCSRLRAGRAGGCGARRSKNSSRFAASSTGPQAPTDRWSTSPRVASPCLTRTLASSATEVSAATSRRRFARTRPRRRSTKRRQSLRASRA